MVDLPVSNVLSKYFDRSVNQSSPVVIDYVRVVHKDEKGNEYVTYEPFDSKKYQESLGQVDNWSLNELLKAGIDPRFGVHTGFGTRLEGFEGMQSFVKESENIVKESENIVEESKN